MSKSGNRTINGSVKTRLQQKQSILPQNQLRITDLIASSSTMMKKQSKKNGGNKQQQSQLLHQQEETSPLRQSGKANEGIMKKNTKKRRRDEFEDNIDIQAPLDKTKTKPLKTSGNLLTQLLNKVATATSQACFPSKTRSGFKRLKFNDQASLDKSGAFDLKNLKHPEATADHDDKKEISALKNLSIKKVSSQNRKKQNSTQQINQIVIPQTMPSNKLETGESALKKTRGRPGSLKRLKDLVGDAQKRRDPEVIEGAEPKTNTSKETAESNGISKIKKSTKGKRTQKRNHSKASGSSDQSLNSSRISARNTIEESKVVEEAIRDKNLINTYDRTFFGNNQQQQSHKFDSCKVIYQSREQRQRCNKFFINQQNQIEERSSHEESDSSQDDAIDQYFTSNKELVELHDRMKKRKNRVRRELQDSECLLPIFRMWQPHKAKADKYKNEIKNKV